MLGAQKHFPPRLKWRKKAKQLVFARLWVLAFLLEIGYFFITLKRGVLEGARVLPRCA
jgi:hypothetical protein